MPEFALICNDCAWKGDFPATYTVTDEKPIASATISSTSVFFGGDSQPLHSETMSWVVCPKCRSYNISAYSPLVKKEEIK